MKDSEIIMVVVVLLIPLFFIGDLRRRQKDITKRIDHLEWGVSPEN